MTLNFAPLIFLFLQTGMDSALDVPLTPTHAH